MADLRPWNIITRPPRRYGAMLSGRGWTIARWRIDDAGAIGLEFCPVIAFVVALPAEPFASEDEVWPMLPMGHSNAVVPMPPEDDEWTLGMYHATELKPSVHTDMIDWEPRALEDAAALVAQAREKHQGYQHREEVLAFVDAQPDPAAFAQRMRDAGPHFDRRSRAVQHVWQAIQDADQDAERAIVNVAKLMTPEESLSRP